MRACTMVAWLAAGVALGGCGGPAATPTSIESGSADGIEGLAGEVHASFALPRGEAADDWLVLPWPNELRRRDDGTIDLRGFPGRERFALSRIFDEAEAAGELRGFSVAPVLYVRFSGALSADEVAQAVATGRIALVDVDPKSPERGRRHALRHRYFAEPTAFLPAHVLALRPLVALRESTLYALAIARRLTAASAPLGTTRDLEIVKATTTRDDAIEERARRLHAPAFDAIGMERSAIALASVFRTQDATETMRSLLESALALGPELSPKLLSASWRDDRATESYHAIHGYYCTPSFQSDLEHAPFVTRGGTIARDAHGRPRVASAPASDDCGLRMRARFVLTVPRAPMPASGWPLLVHAHGTTGDAFSGLGKDSFAERATRAGMASVSTDQPLHGSDDPMSARPGSASSFVLRLGPIPIPLPQKGKGAELAFYNVLRPLVLRDNVRQAAVDAALLARLILASDFAKGGKAGTPLVEPRAGRTAPRFDARFGYVAAGHSQGSQSMAVLGAVDPLVRAVLLSACGGDFSATAVLREDSREAQRVFSVVLGLTEGELDELHPLLTALQTFVDPIDPQSYGRSYHTVVPPRSVLMVHGAGDTMTLDRSAVSLAATLGAEAVGARGLATLEPVQRVEGNVARGRATAALVVLEPRSGADGHFVFFDHPLAQRVSESFLRAVVEGDRAPRVGPLERF